MGGGDYFMKIGNWKRDFRRSAINSLCALMVVFTFASTRSAAQSLPNQWWKTQGTFLFLFTPDPNTGAAETFAAVQAALPRLYSEGIRNIQIYGCLLYTSPSPRDGATSRMPSSA